MTADHPSTPAPENRDEDAATGWKHWARKPWVVGVLALLIGTGIGGAATSQQSKIDDLNQQLDGLQAQLDHERGVAVSVGHDLGIQKQKTQDAVATAKKQAQADLASKSQALSDQQASLDQRAQQLDQATQTLQANTIPDGTWQSGRDYEPGLYRAPGGGSCYWATLNSANTSDIADNNIAPGAQTVQLDTPFFETEGCGKWVKIG